jgi:peptide/nickel transport system permease protein
MSIRSRWKEFRLGIRPAFDELKFTMKQVRKSPLSIVGMIIVGTFAAIAILAPVLAPPVKSDPFMIWYDGYAPNPYPPGTPVNANITSGRLAADKGWTIHYFGIAQGGLDIYYGCIWGTQTAFRIGVIVVAISLAVGLLAGCLAGYYGGIIDEVLMRFTDIVLAFPGLILAMALVIALPATWSLDFGFIAIAIAIFLGLMLIGRSKKLRLTGIWPFMLGFLGLVIFVLVDTYALGTPYPIFVQGVTLGALDKVLIALALVGWPGYTRVIRGEILRVRQEDYIEASKAVGCSDLRTIVRHIMPNAIYPVVIMASLDIGAIVLLAAALSFLGIGAPLGYADWGQMISLARNWIYSGSQNPWQYWYTYLIPGVFIFVFVLGWNLLGDAFRDILDPTLRRK